MPQYAKSAHCLKFEKRAKQEEKKYLDLMSNASLVMLNMFAINIQAQKSDLGISQIFKNSLF